MESALAFPLPHLVYFTNVIDVRRASTAYPRLTGMKRLPEPVKRRIVEHLACYQSPAEVTRLIEEEFGIPLTARHVRAYDPTSSQCTVAQRWVDYHWATRERFRNEAAYIPITHRAFRLYQLQQIFDDAFERGNLRLAAKVLEQAAKEMGNWFVR